jgi:hypothetical protein
MDKFGSKVLKFVKKADRVDAILSELKLKHLARRLKVAKPPSQRVK